MNSSKVHTPVSTGAGNNSNFAKSSAAKAAAALPFANISTLSLPDTPVTSKQHSKTSGSSGGSTKDRSDVVLPQTKVKLIMKTSPAVENIGNDALYLITKSTELFIDYMASTAFTNANSKGLEYKHLAELAQSDSRMEFLKEIIPRKVPARVALQEMAKQKEQLFQ